MNTGIVTPLSEFIRSIWPEKTPGNLNLKELSKLLENANIGNEEKDQAKKEAQRYFILAYKYAKSLN